MAPNKNYVDWKTLDTFLVKAFVGYGVPEEDAKICSNIILEADKKGIKSHGMNRFKPFYLDRIKAGVQMAKTNFEIVKETPATALVDGHSGMGQVIGYRAMRLAMEKAKKCGIGMVAVRNSYHFGIAGYYTTMAAKEGFIALAGTNARPAAAPTFGVQNMLGTNPIAIAAPTNEEFPFDFDAATTIIQRGKIEKNARLGIPSPEGMIISEDGSTLTDSAEIIKMLVAGKAALAPLGGIGETTAGYKGYGLSTAVEILCTALTKGDFMNALNDILPDGTVRQIHIGHFFIAIDTEAFMGLESAKETTTSILKALRASKKAPGQDRIYTAGEKEYEYWLKQKDTGLEVPAPIQKEMITIRDQLNMGIKFPFED